MKLTKFIVPISSLFICFSYAQETWDGAGDTNWSGDGDTTSWSGNTYTDATGAIFDGTNGLGVINITGIVNPTTIDNSVNASGYTLELETGGKLELNNSAVINSNLVINGTGGGGALHSRSGTSTINGDVTVNANTDLRGSNFIFNGAITGERNWGINGSNYVFNDVIDLDANNDGTGGTLGFTSAGTNPANASVLTQSGNDYSALSLNFGGYLRTDAVSALAPDAVVNWGWSRWQWSSGVLDLNGNNQTVGGLAINSISAGLGGDHFITSATDASLTLDNASGTSSEYQGRLEGALSIVKNGDGEQVLNNISSSTAPGVVTDPSPGPVIANSYTGSTTINAGTLSLIGTTSIDSSAEIAIANGAVFSVAATSDKTFGNTVSGTGTIVGDFTAESASGAINPGDGASGIGTLNFQNNLTLASGADINLTLAMALGNDSGLDPTSVTNGIPTTGQHDALNILGALDLSGLGSINLSLDAGYTAMEGDYFDLFDSGSLLGADPSQLSLPSLTGGLSWDTTDFSTRGIIMIVPEPTSGALLGLGALGLLTRRRR